MEQAQSIDKYLSGHPERNVVLSGCVGAALSVLTMLWSNRIGTTIGLLTLLLYSGYRIIQLIRRPECRKEPIRMALTLIVATVAILNAFGFGHQISFLLVLFGIDVYLYFTYAQN
jgi:hypothetical protein